MCIKREDKDTYSPMIFSIDQRSEAALQANGFNLNYNFGKVKLLKSGGGNKSTSIKRDTSWGRPAPPVPLTTKEEQNPPKQVERRTPIQKSFLAKNIACIGQPLVNLHHAKVATDVLVRPLLKKATGNSSPAIALDYERKTSRHITQGK